MKLFMARSFFGINIGHFSHSYRDEMIYSKLINLRNLFQRVNNTNVKSKKHTKSCQFAPEPCQPVSDPEKVRIIVESKNSSRRTPALNYHRLRVWQSSHVP